MRCFSSWNEIPWYLSNWSFVVMWSGNKLEHGKICPEMAIPFFDQLYCQCYFPRNTWCICCIFLRCSMSFSKTFFFFFNNKWVQKRHEKRISTLWGQIKKIRKPFFYIHNNTQSFLGQCLGFSRLVTLFLNIYSCFLLTHQTQTVLVRQKSEGLLNKTIFPIEANRLVVSLWKYKEADRYVNVLY